MNADTQTTCQDVATQDADLAAELERLPAAERAKLLRRAALANDPEPELTLTESGNARRLRRRHGENLRYVAEAKGWHVWTGTHWAPDKMNQAMTLTRGIAEDITREAFAIEATTEAAAERQKALLRWAHSSLSEAVRRKTLTLAAVEPGMTCELSVFDADPWLLNVRNGTLDLRTRQLRQHRRDDLQTYALDVDYDPRATCPRWEQFLREIFEDDRALIDYVRRACGYSLTGNIREQCFFVLHGFGSNGKSTFIDTLREILGPLAQHAQIVTFTERDSGRIPEDRARLRGARFVTVSESGRGQALAEGFVKDCTGGEPITARELYQNSFEFYPQFKLWLATNHKPRITGTDEGIWRRVKLIPFRREFRRAERNHELLDKLRGEQSGILRWLVEGCKAWQDEGLHEPAIVTDATAEYRSESDVLGSFIDECCNIDASLSAGATNLYQAYRAWAEEGGFRAMSQASFGTALRERRFEKRRGTGGPIRWYGLGLSE